MEVQSVVAFDTEELEKLKASNLLKDFVQKQDGCWNHSHWENFITSVRTLGYNLPADVIGAELEVEKEYYWKVRRGEIVVPETTAVAQEAATCMEAVMILEESAKLEPVPCPPEVFDKPREPEMPARMEPFDPITELRMQSWLMKNTLKRGQLKKRARGRKLISTRFRERRKPHI